MHASMLSELMKMPLLVDEFLPNGKGVVTGCADGTVRVWRLPKQVACQQHAFNRKTL